jgi:hypothetical protein
MPDDYRIRFKTRYLGCDEYSVIEEDSETIVEDGPLDYVSA